MTRHYRTLDAIRGVAAIAVVALHAHAFTGSQLFSRAYLAVDLFFILSGVVVSHAYDDRFRSGMGVPRFILIRFVRLYPLYILGTAIGIAFFLAATRLGTEGDTYPGEVTGAIIAGVLMLPSPFILEPHGWITPFNIAAWSLIFELAVNILYAVIWTRLSNRWLAAIIIFAGVFFFGQTLLHGNADVGAEWSTIAMGVPRTLFGFFLGVAIARLPRPNARYTNLSYLILPVMLVTFTPLIAFQSAQDLFMIFLLYPVLIYFGMGLEPRHSRAALALGSISFAIYALHSPLLPIANTGLQLAGTTAAQVAPLGGWVLVAALIAIAWITDIRYDRPVRRWLTGKLNMKRSAAL